MQKLGIQGIPEINDFITYYTCTSTNSRALKQWKTGRIAKPKLEPIPYETYSKQLAYFLNGLLK